MILQSHLQIYGIETFSNFHRLTSQPLRLQVAGQPQIRCEKEIASNPDVTEYMREWEMIQPVKAKADARAVEDILSALGSLRVVVFEAEGEYSTADYGLDPPKITVALQTSTDGQIQELQIGSDAETPGRIYVGKRRTPRRLCGQQRNLHKIEQNRFRSP